MKQLYKYFFRGLLTVLPLALTVYLLVFLLRRVESLALAMFRPVIGSFYVPGIGILFGVAFIIGIGALLSKPQVREGLAFIELPFTTLPVVKSIYSSLKSFVSGWPTHVDRRSRHQLGDAQRCGRSCPISLARWVGSRSSTSLK